MNSLKINLILSLLCCINEITAKDIIVNQLSDLTKKINYDHVNYIVKSQIDLNGKALSLSPKTTITFKGGGLSNGTLIGNNTSILYSEPVLTKIKIKGTWDMPEIKSIIFTDRQRSNVLKDLLAFASSENNNTIYIEPGVYYVDALSNTKGALDIPSNTNLIINGKIYLRPNDFDGCSVIRLKNVRNVTVSGSGSIIGDKSKHKSSSGEWGMGIQIMGSHNVVVTGLNIYDCWGDCIYIGANSSNINISNCTLHDARRQGISITYAHDCIIEKCKIYGIGGTAPGYGIDFEPNAECYVKNMIVKDTEIFDCKGGILAGIKGVTAKNASVGDIKIEGCYIHNLRSKNIFRWHNCSNITVKNCKIDREFKKCAFKVDSKNVRYINILEKK